MRLGCVGVGLIGLSVFAGATSVSRDARADDDTLALDLGGLTLETRKVTHGGFIQGSPAAEPGHQPDEEPARQVTISKDFWIGKFPVTRAQFAKFVADTRYVSDAEKGQAGGAGWDGKSLTQKKEFSWRSPGFTQTDEHPVVMVSYGDANAFVGWASRKSGKRVRLPTEAEWEYAARGGQNTAWYGGSTEADALALGWFKANAGNGTRPVGQKKPNVLGVFDMAGDVFEWCRDVYAPYKEGAVVDPEAVTTSAEPERRVLRGGSWLRDPKRGRSGGRHKSAPGSRSAEYGFRVVVTNEETVAPAPTGASPDFAPQAPVGLGASSGAPAVSGGSGASAGPLADGEAVRLAPMGQGSESFSWGLLLASPLAAASAAVAWMLLRRRRAPGAAGQRATGTARTAGAPRRSSTSSTITTRPEADGFYIVAPNVVPGTRVRYDCVADGQSLSDVVPLEGPETFVYTGGKPSAVRILGSIAPGPDVPSASPRPPATSATPPRPPPPVPLRAPPPPPSSPHPAVAAVPPAPPSSLTPPSDPSPAPPSSRPSAPPLPPPPPSAAVPPPLPSTRAVVPPAPPSSSASAPPAPPSSSASVPPAPPSSSASVPPAPPSSRPSGPPPRPSTKPFPPSPPSSRPMLAPSPPSSRPIPPSPPSSRPSGPPAPPSSAPNPFLVPFVDTSPSSGSLPTATPPPVAPAAPSSGSLPTESPPAVAPGAPSPAPPTAPAASPPATSPPAASPASDVFDGHPRAY